MLAGREQVTADVGRKPRVFRAVDRRVIERRGAAPVFVRGVGVEDVGLKRRLGRVRQQPVGHAGFRIVLLGVGERKDVGRVEEVQVGMAVA